MAEEVELKFEVAEKTFSDLKTMKKLIKQRRGLARRSALRATYFDTADRALQKNNISLRLRHKDGELTQTVKISSSAKGGTQRRREYDLKLCAEAKEPDLSLLDADARDQVRASIGNDPLEPIVITDVERETWDLVDGKGTQIELAFDEGEVSASGHSLPIREIELELVEGDPQRLYKLANKLLDEYELDLQVMSKADRGYALLDTKRPKHVKAIEPNFDAGATVEDAFVEIVRACLVQVVANKPAMTVGKAVEGLHQMRVGLRRLRSGLEAFESAMGKKTTKSLEKEAKLMARILGRARDHDVFLAELLKPVEKAYPHDARLRAFRAATEGRREACWQEVTNLLASSRFARFVLAAEELIDERPWRDGTEAGSHPVFDAPISPHAAQELEKLYLDARKLGDRLDELDEEERHELRKRLKKLRYGFAFFSDLFPDEAVKPQLKHLSDMQDAFGALNDFASAHEMVEAISSMHGKLEKALGEDELPDLGGAGELILDFHRERADAEHERADELWQEFAADEKFWRDALPEPVVGETAS